MGRYEWNEVEQKIRTLCEQIGRLQYEVWSVLEDANDVNALQRCANISQAMYEEADRLWYTCPDYSYHYCPAGRKTKYMLTVAWSDTVHIAQALLRVSGKHSQTV